MFTQAGSDERKLSYSKVMTTRSGICHGATELSRGRETQNRLNPNINPKS